MKVLIQWAINNPIDWIEIDSKDWVGLPKKNDPVGNEVIDNNTGWINRICIQGVEFTSDHYAIEDLPSSGCRVYSWSDDPEDYLPGYKNAKICEFLYLDYDSQMGGAINTKQKFTYYVEDEVRKNMPSSIGGCEIFSWLNFVKPSEEIIKHGIWIENKLYQEHEEIRNKRGWREWTEGINLNELDNTGRIKYQRKLGRYIIPKGTRTYYHNNVTTNTSLHSVDSTRENTLGITPAGASSETSVTLGGGADAEIFVATTPLNEPDTSIWPSGEYRCQLDVTTVGLDITYGLLNLGASVGHFARVNSALTTGVDSKQQVQSAFAGTGLKLATFSGGFSGSTKSDRFEILIAAQRAANHGNQTLTMELGETDDFADGPWSPAFLNSTFFGCNF
jgi:hypothetical protein